MGVLNRKVHIWDDLLQAPINEHVKKIISSYIEDAMMVTTKDISEIMQTHTEVGERGAVSLLVVCYCIAR